jgi:hypothetical protein
LSPRGQLVVLACLLAGCEGGVQRRSGLEALLQVQRGQYFEGAFPTDQGGPAVLGTNTATVTLRVGQTNRTLSGSIGLTSTTVAVGLEGDSGYWLVPAGGTDSVVASALAFEASLGFSRFITPGPHVVRVAASDASGHFGPSFPVTFDFVDFAAPPTADLRVTLSWDVDADLDLHVVQPDGTEIWSRKSTTYVPPVVGPIDQAAANAAARLDFDSNSMCVLDGRRTENVLFLERPPVGEYTVRVDTFSLCGQPAARWTVDVVSLGVPLTSASGTALPSSTRFPHERGAGALAATFTLP